MNEINADKSRQKKDSYFAWESMDENPTESFAGNKISLLLRLIFSISRRETDILSNSKSDNI
ncbi:hypothetical protein N425_13550 [Tannerella sp. oral taxon BU063 isolate Cell 2]|jgi:hypothetical protein|uniref:Uncharacterized protein n=1 Tax=Tannerella sp. oral taxon BU063 isolate Cell 2 TaxID=1411148 RepID=W2C0Y4_9BACT|nr:hypothetical protein N425_13550 [Tannerella sp. oral taxon BU063 isolate Cell 2]